MKIYNKKNNGSSRSIVLKIYILRCFYVGNCADCKTSPDVTESRKSKTS
jgi:hypothetical protein